MFNKRILMDMGDKYKNFNELDGLFTYIVKEIKKDTIIMNLIFPVSWQVPNYKTSFNINSVHYLLEKI